MILNYLRIGIRNLFRNKLYSFINIAGLAVGLAVCMTILLYVSHEHSYDSFHHDRKKIFVLGGSETFGGQKMEVMSMNHVVAPMLQQISPQVTSYMRVHESYSTVDLSLKSNPAVHFREKRNFLFADSNFFRFFSFRLLRGDESGALSEPNSVVMCESAAKKYFGQQDPIGQLLVYQRNLLLKVTGVCADPPSNSSISFSFVIPFSLIPQTEEAWQVKMDWFGVGNFFTLLKLNDTAASKKVAAAATKLAAMDKSGMSNNLNFQLSLLTDNHLSSNPFTIGRSTRFLSLFSLVAGLILLLALINYMSLATARAVTRAREVGVRKAIGADRKNIAAQFYIESAISAILSFAISVFLFLTLRHLFFDMISLHIDASFLKNPVVVLSFLALLILTILMSGSYPAILLSSYKPVAVLYGRLSNQRSGTMIRKGLTVLQFAISIALVISTLFIAKQLKFMQETDTGVDRNNVVMIDCEKTMNQYQSFKKEVAAMPSVQKTATANYRFYNGLPSMAQKTKTPGREIQISDMIVDTDFISLMGLHWKEKPEMMSSVMDGRHPILNEVAVAEIGFSGNPIGQIVRDQYKVGGVLQNFNYVSLQEGIKPLELYIGLDTPAFGVQNNTLFVRFWPHTNVRPMLEKIRKSYTSFDKTSEFSFQFLDDAYKREYIEEDRLASLMSVFTTITVIIACLGLLALATFSAHQRIKEIGIRKVLGASVKDIATSLSIKFLRPVGLSLLLAIPVSGWVMHNWLNNYAYRISLNWRVFIEASSLMVLLASATVFFLSVKAAKTNPATTLRSE